MSLRISYAAALQFLRVHRESSQQKLGQAADQSYISRLESGTRSVTLDVSQELAQALGVDPLTLLVLAYASDRGQTPHQVLDHLLTDLTKTGLLDSEIPSLPSKRTHPISAAAEQLHAQIKVLVAKGLSPSEIARRLGVARQTVSNHLKKMK